MKRYRAEVLGAVPNGLTHNDVFASFMSMVKEYDSEARVTKRRLAGNMISLIVTFEADSEAEARAIVYYAKTGVLNFSADTVGFREA